MRIKRCIRRIKAKVLKKDAMGIFIAEKLKNVTFNGFWEKSKIYTFTDNISRSVFMATNFKEAKEKLIVLRKNNHKQNHQG